MASTVVLRFSRTRPQTVDALGDLAVVMLGSSGEAIAAAVDAIWEMYWRRLQLGVINPPWKWIVASGVQGGFYFAAARQVLPSIAGSSPRQAPPGRLSNRKSNHGTPIVPRLDARSALSPGDVRLGQRGRDDHRAKRCLASDRGLAHLLSDNEWHVLVPKSVT